jgi:hypothetical protein
MELSSTRTDGGGEGTYRGNSARGRDCAHCPAGLSESVSEHGDRSLCIKGRMKNQLPWQLMEGRWEVEGRVVVWRKRLCI